MEGGDGGAGGWRGPAMIMVMPLFLTTSLASSVYDAVDDMAAVKICNAIDVINLEAFIDVFISSMSLDS